MQCKLTRAAIILLPRKPSIVHSRSKNPNNLHIKSPNLYAISHRLTREEDDFLFSLTHLASGLLHRFRFCDRSIRPCVKSFWGFASRSLYLVVQFGDLRRLEPIKGLLLDGGRSGKLRAPPWPDPGSRVSLALEYRTGVGFSLCERSIEVVLLSCCKKSPLRYGLLSVVARSLFLSLIYLYFRHIQWVFRTHPTHLVYHILLFYHWLQISNWCTCFLSVMESNAMVKGKKPIGVGSADLLSNTSRKGKKPIGVGSAVLLSTISQKGPKSLFKEKIQAGSPVLDDGGSKARKLKEGKKTINMTVNLENLGPLMASPTEF